MWRGAMALAIFSADAALVAGRISPGTVPQRPFFELYYDDLFSVRHVYTSLVCSINVLILKESQHGAAGAFKKVRVRSILIRYVFCLVHNLACYKTIPNI